MPDIRNSVMVLPRHDDAILLQSFTHDNGDIVWDGFGSFYQPDNTPLETVVAVMRDYFKSIPPSESLKKAASLHYFINKSTGLVDLRITIYFADVDSKLNTTKQMAWFTHDKIPLQKMHAATAKWLPIILKNPKLLTATIRIEQSGHHTAGKVTEFTID